MLATSKQIEELKKELSVKDHQINELHDICNHLINEVNEIKKQLEPPATFGGL